ncbi:MAG: hypothetical protein LC750_18505 [Actinobacteria bacterium]|nr:hypothetical protein [Actinomycetota bacterium]
MGDAILCMCGAVLVDEVTKDGVVPIGGDPIVFRRDTDYIVCADCHRVYKAKMLLDGMSLTRSLVADGSGDAPPDDHDAIAKLEQLVEGED